MTLISSPNHWWQNWSKTHAYVAEKMFFPKSADDVASAIRAAEADRRPVRAVGGGWSFSDASLPGSVTTNRPKIHVVEAVSEVLPFAERFPADKTQSSIASIPTNLPPMDAPGSMVMLYDPPDSDADPVPFPQYQYQGQGVWTDGPNINSPSDQDYTDWFDAFFVRSGNKPIRNPGALSFKETDVAGTLVMFDLTKDTIRPSRDWFYNGHGVWSVGVAGESEHDQGELLDLRDHGRLGGGAKLSIRAADCAETLALLLSKRPPVAESAEPVYLINTRSLVASLQQNLPNILSQHAIDATDETEPRRFFFHVEAGITIAELGALLSHQSPRLSLQAISGSPGATLAGALSTATHGAEFNWPPLIDRVKAVHLVGPCGLHWWIEGDESIADPEKLRHAYPHIDWHRIITGKNPVGGILPQDWLNAVVVSMGSMGVIHSVVVEVVPLFGVREVVVQKTWRSLGYLGEKYKNMDLSAILTDPQTSQDVSTRIVKLLQNGEMNGTDIPQVNAGGYQVNQYADLAINPNRRPDGDYDCWIGNREVTAQVPLDNSPAPPGVIDGLGKALNKDIIRKFGVGLGLESFTQIAVGDFPDVIRAANQAPTLSAVISRLTKASDLPDVGLDTFLTPLTGKPDGVEVTQALLSGILSGLLNTANPRGRSDLTGVNVGALGFPEGGIMGTAIEIALAPADAFGFIQTEILDKITMYNTLPFFGYVSIRLCSKTQTLMGMQQFGDPAHDCSVMIEVVAFGTDVCRQAIQDLQRRTLQRIALPNSDPMKLDAMLHWGLENEQLTAKHLGSIRPLQAMTRSGMTKLETFRTVRGILHAACLSPFRVFDNNFTDRLGFSTYRPLDISYLIPLLLAGEGAVPVDLSYLVPLLLSSDPT
jgi:hypothetical protein